MARLRQPGQRGVGGVYKSILAYGALSAALLGCLYLVSLAPLRLDWGRELAGGAIAVIALLAGLQAARRSSAVPIGSEPGTTRASPPPAPDSPPVEQEDPGSSLSMREIEVLQLLCAGRSNKEIARSLQLSENTIKTHLAHVYDKLGVSKRVEAMAAAQRLGLIRRGASVVGRWSAD